MRCQALQLNCAVDGTEPEDSLARHSSCRERGALSEEIPLRRPMTICRRHKLTCEDDGSVAHAGRDGAGDLEYMGVLSDMTERNRAEEERQALAHKLEESNARLEEAQRVAHVGHWEWDLDTNEVVWSDET